ncbi:MAG: hypothetical protein GY757_56340 [bacterium]|nr:hypothetical protein [bacterium]
MTIHDTTGTKGITLHPHHGYFFAQVPDVFIVDLFIPFYVTGIENYQETVV